MTPLRSVPCALLCAAVLHAAPKSGPSAPPVSPESPPAGVSDFESVRAEAMRLADKPYVPAKDATPDFFRKLPHESFREIRCNPGTAEWADNGSPFRAQFLHPGPFREDTAAIFRSEGGEPLPVPYSRERFDFGKLRVPDGVRDPAGYAGFRWHGEIDARGVRDDFATFLGTGYFRCLPSQPDAVYGIAARALAIDTALSDRPEEFPVFKKFLLERPAKGASAAIAYALMDSPSVCGAYRFEIVPGKVLTGKVRVALYFRKKPERLGLVPFSTMFRFGENSLPRPSDFRPEVHDSDGLVFETDKGLRYWRPLVCDPHELRHSVFTIGKPKEFGLRQRDQDFGSYEDLDENYHRKPGVRVTPGAGWPEGTLQLLEMPDGGSTWDNVVLYWAPTTIPGPGEALSFDYTVRWAFESDFGHVSGRVVATRVGDVKGHPGTTRYVVDFADSGENAKDVPVLKTQTYADAEIVASRLVFHSEIRGWRAIVDVRPYRAPADPAKPAPKAAEPLRPGVRAWLERKDRIVSERWDYRAPVTK